MSSDITLTFLGTTSGGGPTETRNCSSLVVEPLGDGSLWMVDCAEGTVRQFAQQPFRNDYGPRRLRINQVNKIFVTHMHADHTMGLLTVLRNVLGIPKPPSATNPNAPPPNASPPRIEIFGPRGVRRMLRTLWHLTHTHSENSYVVHELLFPGEQPSVEADASSEQGANEADVRRESECVGRDIWCDDQGFWRGIVEVPASRHRWGALVDAGPIQHRDPCIGYIIRELPFYELSPTSPLPRKLVILGDTYDASPLVPLVHADPPSARAPGAPSVPVSLLVHEATDAYLPPRVDPHERTGRNRTEASVEAKTRDRGHSTPAMAGAFARQIGAERLVLNHIGARFPAPEGRVQSGQEKFRVACMREIERQAAQTWRPPRRVYPQAAWDFLVVSIPPNRPRAVEVEVSAPSEALLEHAAAAAAAEGARGLAGEEEMVTEVEMEEGAQAVAAPLSEEHAARLAETFGVSAEAMGARHDREREREKYRKRERDASSGHRDREHERDHRPSGSAGGSGRGGGGGNGRGRGGYESRRGYGTSSGGGGGGGRGRGDNKRARGRGGGYERDR